MAEIRTTGLEGGDLVTNYQAGETVRDWVGRHSDAYKNLDPDSTVLRSEWPVGQSKTTTQQPGESPSLHHARHWNEVVTAMQTNPPDPS